MTQSRAFTIQRNGITHTVDPDKKIAVCGFASSSRMQAPYADPSFTIAGLNSLYAMIPMDQIQSERLIWYEIHPLDHVKKNLQRTELLAMNVEHIGWLKSIPGPGEKGHFPIYMQDHFEEVPASVKWPREEINAWICKLTDSTLLRDYFTSTPGEMVAHAIWLGYGEIHLYGVDLLQNEEYAYQRPGAEAWAAFAAGLGIKVVIPESSALFKANYVYGYSEPTVEFGKMEAPVTFCNDLGTQMERTSQEVAAMLNTIQGARQAITATLEKVRAGETTTSIEAWGVTQLEDLVKKFDAGKETLVKLSGQRELAGSMASWLGHFGRGGVLPSPSAVAPSIVKQ